MPETTAKTAETHGGLTAAEAKMFQAPMTRREFLGLAWLATIGIFSLQIGVVTYFFALPRFRAGEFGGQFDLGTANETIPQAGGAPAPNQKGKIWISNTERGVLALYNVCVHLGCLYYWQPVNNRFECPCHGSKYQKDGKYIEGPAPRSLDRMVIRFIDANGNELAKTNSKGDPLPIPDPNARFIVETGQIINGEPHG